MLNIESIYFFIFVFASLVLLRNIFNFISALSSPTPKPFVLNDRELLILGSAISYLITYMIYR